MSVYRKKHFAHHRHLGSGEDPRLYQYQISLKNFICWSFLIFPLKKFYYLYFFSPVLNTTAASTKTNYEKIICISVVIIIHSSCVFFSFPNIEKYIFLTYLFPDYAFTSMELASNGQAEHRAEITSG